MSKKLPVLYVLDPHRSGHIHAMPSPEQFVGYDPSRIFAYEPAVPRCKTCKYWQADYDANDEFSGHYCDKGVDSENDDGIPQDGSGYCHRHQEARR